MKQRIILAGGSGFLGRSLARRFVADGCEVVVLTRSPNGTGAPARDVFWDGRTLGNWAAELDGAFALVNLTGRSVNCRYGKENRRQILESRVDSTRVLGEAIARCARPPAVWLNSSTATIYKHSLDRPMDEAGEIAATPEAKDAFSVEVACAWEGAFLGAAASRRPAGGTPPLPGKRTRKVALRTAIVFGAGEGGVFRVLRRLTRFGLGGRMAGGRQYVSWIHEDDFFRAVRWLMFKDDFSGPVNLAAPNPVTNREMMRLFRRQYGLPIGLPATRWMLEAGAVVLRTETELIIKSRRVAPGRLLASGFEFQFSRMEDAVREIESRITRRV